MFLHDRHITIDTTSIRIHSSFNVLTAVKSAKL